MTDRNGKLLTINEPIYQIELTYNQFARSSESFDTTRFCQLLGITRDYFEGAIPEEWGGKFSPSKPFTFLANVSPAVYATFQENLFQFPGFSATLRSSRNYPHSVAAHLLGYLGEVSQTTIDRGEGRYSSGDYHGISGLEYQYEDELRGEKGRRLVYRDRLGREAGEVLNGAMDVDATVGTDLITSIDLDLQEYGEALMVNKIGSIVALEPATGEILTMISAPTYDPRSLRIGRDRGRAFTNLQQDTLQPLLNRAINGKYPPGSPFQNAGRPHCHADRHPHPGPGDCLPWRIRQRRPHPAGLPQPSVLRHGRGRDRAELQRILCNGLARKTSTASGA